MADYFTGNFWLTTSQMQTNATFIYNTLKNEWTVEAISALLGNTETESTINPGIWQNLALNKGPGYGLTQWTPYSKYFNWCDANGLQYDKMESAIARIRYEVQHPNEQWVTHSSYPLTFQQFTQSTASPYYLGITFLNNYEMPNNLNQPFRGTQSENWYKFLTGDTPPGPGPGEGGNDRNVYHRGKGILIPILKGGRYGKIK